jgi:DNA protecting protein DprA
MPEIKDLLFLIYLTNYNVKEIYYAIDTNQLTDVKKYVNSFLKKKNENAKFTTSTIDITIKKAVKEAEYCFDSLRYFDIKAIPYFSHSYPENLRKISNPPPILFVKGIFSNNIFAAVVGSRETSKYAQENTKNVVEVLKSKNYGIVSGLASGIDTMAHKSALEMDCYTIAVLPNSLDSIYPKENMRLASEIIDHGGALVTEIPLGINLGKQSFIERNRIQTGLSNIVIPVEMGVKSGTMHTVNFCKQQKKKLFLFQPKVEYRNLPNYQGINYLIDEQVKKKNDLVVVVKSINDFEIKLEHNDIVSIKGPNYKSITDKDNDGSQLNIFQ